MTLWTYCKDELSSSLATYPSIETVNFLKDLSVVLSVILSICNSRQPLQRRCQVRSGSHTKCVQFSFSYIARSCSAEHRNWRFEPFIMNTLLHRHQCHETNLQFLSYAAIQAVIVDLRSLGKMTGE